MLSVQLGWTAGQAAIVGPASRRGASSGRSHAGIPAPCLLPRRVARGHSAMGLGVGIAAAVWQSRIVAGLTFRRKFARSGSLLQAPGEPRRLVTPFSSFAAGSVASRVDG